MKILEIKTLALPEIKIIKFAHFNDERGYFTETYRKTNFKELDFFKNIEFTQINESFSRKGTFRGLHFQWNPYMGKLVRTIYGNILDFALDIRKDSETFGKIIAYDLKAMTKNTYESSSNEWIWLPPGFAHGILAKEDSMIEYLCSGQYNPECEKGISPLAQDIDWSLCEPKLKRTFDEIVPSTKLITDKDKNAISLTEWKNDESSDNFIKEKL